MNPSTFDQLAKLLASDTSSRRGLLRTLLGGGAAMTAAVAIGATAQPAMAQSAGCCPGDQVPTGCACPSGTTDCGNDTCKDLQNDASNCGACGNACGWNQVCAGGYCNCAPGAQSCWLNGTPVCVSCNYSQTINGTTCQCECVSDRPTQCPDGICHKIDGGDTNNCGACGSVCPTIPAGRAACCEGGYCVELSNDPNNCGACGYACAAGQTCTNGICY